MTLFDRVFNGSDDMFNLAAKAVDDAINQLGPEAAVSLPNTAYGLPCLYAFTGKKYPTLASLKEEALADIQEFMNHDPQLHNVFTSGVGTALSAEVIETVKYMLNGNEKPYDDRYHGHLSDAEIRELGVPLVTDDIPGVAVLIHEAPSPEIAADLIKGYQAKGIMVFLVGGIIDQAIAADVNLGFKIRIVPLGPELPSVIHVVSVAIRAALIFGACTPGDYDGILKYTFDRVKAFVNAFAPLDDMTVACGGGAIALGFPVMTDETENIWSVPKSLLLYNEYENYVDASIEMRNIKIKITEMDIPVSYAAAFEGEIIRRNDMQLEANGSRLDCFELVRTIDANDIEDHKITLIGKDFEEFEEGGRFNLGLLVEVAGNAMQSDFESVLERKIHHFINNMEGIMHTGQRDNSNIRVSKTAFNAGFRAKHFGEVLYAKMKDEFEAVVDKCQVTVYTDAEECKDFRFNVAIPIWDKRDERLESLTDESVDVFYTCTLCQSFSPSHVCIVTPERLGLCGAVSWLDAKATKELDPSGPCQIVTKGGLIDEVMGSWDDVNAAVAQYSRGALSQVTLYSILEDPMTSCGCFECICGIEPASNGVIIVNREYVGTTPIGMSFGELASMTGGGIQTPGFMGHGKHFIASKKFMRAEGGIERIVWMPKQLKETVADRLNHTAKELYGIDNFVDMIADEETAPDEETLVEFLTEKNHPALSMDPLM
ncbi:MAG: acetyl-CoA decarbonylase/synthase complex subunit alpha/beta [Eubacteriaceae bacterium]|nr:acetyl-CoA decarbonylase/synthase complex subunit alpha/beta [Eubacteriaceae bacterium]